MPSRASCRLRYSFEVLVAVQAQLGIVGEVRAELEEEGAKVAIHRVDVVVIDQRRGRHQPRIGPPRLGVAPFRGAADGRLLLRLADEEHAFLPLELRQVRGGDLVFALPFAEGEQRHALCARESLQGRHEGGGDDRHQRGGGEGGAAVLAKEVGHPAGVLQPGHIHVQIQAVDALNFQSHMLSQDGSNRVWYAHTALWLWDALRSQLTATRSYMESAYRTPFVPATRGSPVPPSTNANPVHLVGLRRSLVRLWITYAKNS